MHLRTNSHLLPLPPSPPPPPPQYASHNFVSNFVTLLSVIAVVGVLSVACGCALVSEVFALYTCRRRLECIEPMFAGAVVGDPGAFRAHGRPERASTRTTASTITESVVSGAASSFDSPPGSPTGNFDLIGVFYLWSGIGQLVCAVLLAILLRAGVVFRWRRSVTSTLCRIIIYAMVVIILLKLKESAEAARTAEDPKTMSQAMWFELAMTGLLQIPLYIAPALPSTGSGAHALILLAYVFTMMWVQRQTLTTTVDVSTQPFANVGLLLSMIGAAYNLKMEHTFRTFLARLHTYTRT